ncbi:PAS domain-containing protein [Nocardia brasiliensis]|uniref:histidine kinase n=1 Tax=Nocardia brasiliensis TaxID=37326 RepID=A0A6G9XR78_NOCBR|nr:PAS and ANTAR domain-containing protein [Nocardia brasiliensis]QIS03424.1 PAS domain-containing protein [Nocardia brasiliensis]
MDQPVDMPDITRDDGTQHPRTTPLFILGTEPKHPIAEVLGAGAWQSAGTFRFWPADERWEWSDEVAQIHGYAPGTVQPTTELLLSHKHPEDREQVANTIARTVETGEPFCSRHRIIDTRGRTHHVLVVGDDMRDEQARVVGTCGYYVDLTDTLAEDRRRLLDGALPELYTARAAVEQAKGVLMLVYGVTADQALRVLVWRAQETGVELRGFATQLLTELAALDASLVELRTRFDHLLLTVHERM